VFNLIGYFNPDFNPKKKYSSKFFSHLGGRDYSINRHVPINFVMRKIIKK
jgi:hypothetical protein